MEQEQPSSSSSSSSSPLEIFEIVHTILLFIGRGHYRFVAILNRLWNDVYTQINPNDPYTYFRLSSLDVAKIMYTESTDHHKSIILCRCAARYGNVNVLQYLRSSTAVGPVPCTWDASICHTAAKYGHLPILQYAYRNKCPWGKHTVYYATIHGHIHIVMWSQMMNLSWKDDYVLRCAVLYPKHKKYENVLDLFQQHMNIMD